MAELVRIKVWDLPIRLFHWTLLGLVAFAWWSAETHHMDWHKMAGAGVAGLMVFRLWWGLFGGSTARFSSFLKGPSAVIAYARGLFRKGSGGHDGAAPGHNPMGGWSVAGLLLVTITTVGFGLFAVDEDGLESGPFSNLVNFDQGRLASKLHDMSFDALKVLVVLHLAAIAFYLVFKRDNLVRPMVTGSRLASSGSEGLKPGKLSWLLAGLLLAGFVTFQLIRMSQSAV
jgi:cytochrome b